MGPADELGDDDRLILQHANALDRLKRSVLQKLVADSELAADLADSLALEARRDQPHAPLRDALKDQRIRVCSFRWKTA